MFFARNGICAIHGWLQMSDSIDFVTLFAFAVGRMNFYTLVKRTFSRKITFVFVTHAYNYFSRKCSHPAEKFFLRNEVFICPIKAELCEQQIWFKRTFNSVKPGSHYGLIAIKVITIVIAIIANGNACWIIVLNYHDQNLYIFHRDNRNYLLWFFEV